MSYASASEERDETLLHKIAMHLEELVGAYLGWAQEEVRDAITELQIQLQLEHPAALTDELRDSLDRVSQLNATEIDRLRKQVRERMRAVGDGDFQTFRDAREHLDEVVVRCEAISAELLRIRSVLVALAEGTQPED
jgi:hypothetical protein